MKKESAAKRLQKYHREGCTLTAAILTIFNAAFLIWVGYFIFLCATFYEMALPLGMNPARNLQLYSNLKGYPISLIQLLFCIAILSVSVVFLGTKIYLEHSKARIRQRILLGFISLFLLGYSFGLCLMEDLIYRGALAQIEQYEANVVRNELEQEFRKQKIVDLSIAIERYEQSKK